MSVITDPIKDAWDDTLDFVDDTLDFVKDVVDDVVDFVEKESIKITNMIADVSRKINNIIDIPVISDFIDSGINKIEDLAIKAIEISTDGVRIINDTAYYTLKGINATLQEGDPLQILLTIAAAIATGGTSLIFQFAVPGFTQSLYMHGVISAEWAQAINIAVAIGAMFYGVIGPQDAVGNFTSVFTSLGASSTTALYLANAITTGMAIMQPLFTVYGMYQSYRTVKDLESMYMTYLAQYEAWRNKSQQKQAEQEVQWQEGIGFADGTYYEKLPGQFMYGVFGASREAYVPMDAPQPAYWIENTKSPYNADKEVANIMWQNKNVEFRNKFDLIPYEIDTGSTVGNRTFGGGGVKKFEYEAAVAKREAAIVEYNNAVAERDKAIIERDAVIFNTESTIKSKIEEFDSKIKELNIDLAGYQSSIESLYINKQGTSFSIKEYDPNSNKLLSATSAGTGNWDGKIQPIIDSAYNNKKIIEEQLKSYQSGKLQLADQLKKLESM